MTEPRYTPDQMREIARTIPDSDLRIAAMLRQGADAMENASIDCPLCGVTVKQVASVTLSLALWQHVQWVCSQMRPDELTIPTDANR